MNWLLPCALLCGWLTASSPVHAAELVRRSWSVGEVSREGWVHVPENPPDQGAPVVLVFHGHGGSAGQAARSMPVHAHWPEALVVYLQGLPTPGRLTDREGRLAGWQAGPGAQGDRDLALVDAVLTDFAREFSIDATRVYACGHSNGGAFTLLLWAMRREKFAAFAVSGAVASRDFPPLTAAPVLHLAGREDRLVRFAWQERMIARYRELNACEARGRREGERITRYASASGATVVTYIHDGGHRFPSEAARDMALFLREHARR